MCGAFSANEPHVPSLDGRIDTHAAKNHKEPHALSRSTRDRLSLNPSTRTVRMTDRSPGMGISSNGAVLKLKGGRSRNTPELSLARLSGPCAMSRLGRDPGLVNTSSVTNTTRYFAHLASTREISAFERCCSTCRI